MNTRFILSTVCLATVIMLSGCLGGGGGSGSGGGAFFGGGGTDVADGGSIIGGGPGDTTLPNNPEPATILLLSSGLAGYAILKRKRGGR